MTASRIGKAAYRPRRNDKKIEEERKSIPGMSYTLAEEIGVFRKKLWGGGTVL